MTRKGKNVVNDEPDEVLNEVESALKKAVKGGKTGGFLYISLDNLPMIISSHGDSLAEETINNLKKSINKLLEKNDLLMAGDRDHINIILYDYDSDKIREKALEIHRKIQNYGCTESIVPISLISTIGSVDFPQTANTPKDIINKAYIALKDAKDSFQRHVAFGNTKKHEIESKNQMLLASYIQSALLNEKLRLAFQPIVNTKTGEVQYYESLLRIICDDGTTTSAGPFIPIAEKMGFIDIIDAFVMQLVLEELRNHKDVKLSLNISQASIHNYHWTTMAINLLKQNDNLTDRLLIEITETSEARNTKQVAAFITALHELGCQIALDDFGSGYTSFSQLKNLSVDMIKIDGSFVRDITNNFDSKFFVKTLIDFGKNFELQTVAEYVENEAIANMLREMGVDYMQGNYFSPAVNYRSWVETSL